MLSPVQIYAEATIAVALTAMIGVISAFITAAATGHRALGISGGLIMLVLTGALLTARLWRLTRIPDSDRASKAGEANEG
jgi:hypothetical protein